MTFFRCIYKTIQNISWMKTNLVYLNQIYIYLNQKNMMNMKIIQLQNEQEDDENMKCIKVLDEVVIEIIFDDVVEIVGKLINEEIYTVIFLNILDELIYEFSEELLEYIYTEEEIMKEIVNEEIDDIIYYECDFVYAKAESNEYLDKILNEEY